MREADRAQQPDFARALLDAEPEEQRRQQQRRGDEEEAEVGEVLAEVGRAARRGEPVRPHAWTAKPSASGSSRAASAVRRIARGRVGERLPGRGQRCASTCDRRSATATAAARPRTG